MTKLLLDQNLSFKISKEINHLFTEVKHVSDLRLQNVFDSDIWKYAQQHHFSIVTFDADFIDISVLHGFPPKIIWLRIGNSSTSSVIQTLKTNHIVITEFLLNKENACLEIY